jgi:hypothetical protein
MITMRLRRAVALALVLVVPVLAKKKKPEDETQTLALPVDPPLVATGRTSRLIFNVAPLSNKGLLSQQTRDALKAILKANGGVPVIHVRAFVAGSGDMRRVPQIVSEVFGEKHMALPSVSVVQVGAVPLEGAQILIEAVSESKKDVNADGLTFGVGPSPEQALHGAMPLMVTCFSETLGAIPGVNVVQMQRASGRSANICEAIGHGGDVRDPKLAFTGTQVAIGGSEKALQRIDRELAGAKIVAMNVYSLNRRVDGVPKEATVVPVEGVASSDGTLAVDAIAIPRSGPW